jgi:hypothetical protein
MALISRVRREKADALGKASEDSEREIASKISRRQLKEHTGTESKGSSNFEPDHFRNVPAVSVKGCSRVKTNQRDHRGYARSINIAAFACHANHGDVCTVP